MKGPFLHSLKSADLKCFAFSTTSRCWERLTSLWNCSLQKQTLLFHTGFSFQCFWEYLGLVWGKKFFTLTLLCSMIQHHSQTYNLCLYLCQFFLMRVMSCATSIVLKEFILFSKVLVLIHRDEEIRLSSMVSEFSFLEDVHLMKGRNISTNTASTNMKSRFASVVCSILKYYVLPGGRKKKLVSSHIRGILHNSIIIQVNNRNDTRFTNTCTTIHLITYY